MGCELGQWRGWDHDRVLDWHLLADPAHSGIARCVSDLNRLHREEPALHELDFDPAGFSWVDANDSEQSVASMLRSAGSDARPVLAAFNFTPVPRQGYRMGVPVGGFWRELLNSDAEIYGGSGWGNQGGVHADEVPWHARPHSLALTLPPLGAVFLAPDSD